MFSLKSKSNSKDNGSDKQLKKLRRQDLLELLVEQLTENERLQGELSEAQSTGASLSAQVDRLKAKLDDKDAQLDHLKAKLDDKDAVLGELFEGLKEITERRGIPRRESILHLEEIAAEYYLRQFSREEAEPEAEPEVESEQEQEPEAAPEPEAEYEPAPEPEPESVDEPAADADETEVSDDAAAEDTSEPEASAEDDAASTENEAIE